MKGIKHFLLILVFVLIIFAALVFTANNPTKISVWLGVDLPELGIGVWIIAAYILGGLTGLLMGVGLVRQIKYKFQVKQLKGRIEQLENSKSSAKSVKKPAN